ncbi:hypothetical protein GTS_42430 [Gandjariella thermophila]|uniref:DNA-binding protein n=1 Tax=Gandjariella thermophila TaxID=1931992 RepID=A0A4D4JC74_9PSEU|nr:hypothetical protein GTS_42430 [Gandjariella thermophila]
MNKSQLIDALAERIGDKKAAGAAVDGLVDVIVRSVQKGEKVNITGFGVFEKRARAARTARNPRTGEAVKVKKTNVPAFRAGSTFKDVVSGAKKLPKATAAKAGSRSTAARSTSTRATATATTTRKATTRATTAKASTAKAGATKAAPKPTARKASTSARASAAAKKPATKATSAKGAAKSTAKSARPAAKKATSTAPKRSSRGKK